MTIFSRIIAGEIPSYKIYEDDMVYAFLDIRPLQLWHILIVPKIEIDHIIDVSEPYYSAMWQAAKKIGHAIQQATKCKKISTLTLGMEVSHAHLHLIPINSEEDIDQKLAHMETTEVMKEIQEKIVSYL